MNAATAVNIILNCPQCGRQHIDAATPDRCRDCGHAADSHYAGGCRWSSEKGGGASGKLRSVEFCHCPGFAPWLNPPHKSHRCGFCNHVWRPADVPTNGVAGIETAGAFDDATAVFDREKFVRELTADCCKEMPDAVNTHRAFLNLPDGYALLPKRVGVFIEKDDLVWNLEGNYEAAHPQIVGHHTQGYYAVARRVAF